MKTINIKLPISSVQEMDDRGQLNPYYITDFISKNLEHQPEDKPLGRLAFYYALKVTDELHYNISVRAKEEGLAMSEFLGRLFLSLYDEVKSL